MERRFHVPGVIGVVYNAITFVILVIKNDVCVFPVGYDISKESFKALCHAVFVVQQMIFSLLATSL